MLCPNCKTPLSISERAGIEIDFCQTCRGVWLDRGELDKLVERAGAYAQPATAPGGSYASPTGVSPIDEDRGRQRDWMRGQGHKPHRKKSFLSDIFDFD